MARQAERWMPRRKWDALVRGEGCPLCASPDPERLIAELRVSRVILASNQAVPGYCMVIYRDHVREPYELDLEKRTAFWEDTLRVGATLQKLFMPAKMNFEILGNGVPHLHCHVKPRFYGDPWPTRPVPFDEEPLLLTPDQREERITLIRRAL